MSRKPVKLRGLSACRAPVRVPYLASGDFPLVGSRGRAGPCRPSLLLAVPRVGWGSPPWAAGLVSCETLTKRRGLLTAGVQYEASFLCTDE